MLSVMILALGILCWAMKDSEGQRSIMAQVTPPIVDDDLAVWLFEKSRGIGVIEAKHLCDTRHQFHRGRVNVPTERGPV